MSTTFGTWVANNIPEATEWSKYTCCQIQDGGQWLN